jgi:triphosphoribosyl-dephospho-CoA synthase
MFKTTNNVNTHKGAIFSLGLISAASALSYIKSETISAENIIIYVKKLYSKAYYDDLKSIDKSRLTAGEKIYLDYGIHGVRREVYEGFPTVFKYSLPFLLDLEKKNLPFNDICIFVLLKIISKTDDTNIISRGGREGLDYAKKTAEEILENLDTDSINDVIKMDLNFISENISPGGSADLLAVTLMIYFLIKN